MTSFYLFARPSFLEGFARLFDFGNTLTEFNYSNAPEQADFIAIASDWNVVGNDLRAAVAQFQQEREGARIEEESLRPR